MTRLFDASAEFELRHVRPRAGRTLIAGSRVYEGREDRRARYPEAVGVDMLDGSGVDVVADLEVPQPGLGWFSHVECISVLEHARRPWLVAQTLEDLMEPGATLHLAVPMMWRPHAYPSDFWRFTTEALPLLFPRIDWKARLYGGTRLEVGPKLPTTKVDGFPFYARTETLGFGVKHVAA